ncbi:hypothetical protein PV661_04935, partial [Streptomyces sp. MD20-1-1]|nr:hypothetical protein [Streptomyces sp. MD20-1-1]
AAADSTVSCSATFSLVIDASSMIGSYTERFTVPSCHMPDVRRGDASVEETILHAAVHAWYEGHVQGEDASSDRV